MIGTAPQNSPPTSAPPVAARPKVVFLNRSYWPDAEATGQLLSELCEDLASDFDLSVVAGQPNQNPAGVAFRRRGWETRRGVQILRVWNSQFAKSFLPGRAMNLLTFLCAATVAACRLRRHDVVVVETDPPLLCWLGSCLRRWRGAKLVVYLQDIYPDLAVALGKLPNNWLVRRLRRSMFNIYRGADRVVVLSRDMRELLIAEGVDPEKIVSIPNWVDTRQIQPEPRDTNEFRNEHPWQDKFVVMYSGNMGLCQRLEDVLDAAHLLRDRRDIHLALVGDGSSRAQLEAQATRLGLDNVSFLPYQPKEQLSQSLSAADLHLVPLDPRVTSYLMPSKLYGILAVGRPVLAIAPADTELAEVIEQNVVGRVAPPERPDLLADAIRRCADQPREMAAMGRNARTLAVSDYDRSISTSRFGELLTDVCAPNSSTSLCGANRHQA